MVGAGLGGRGGKLARSNSSSGDMSRLDPGAGGGRGLFFGFLPFDMGRERYDKRKEKELHEDKKGFERNWESDGENLPVDHCG